MKKKVIKYILLYIGIFILLVGMIFLATYLQEPAKYGIWIFKNGRWWFV